jgi:hypothetical protein
MIVILPKTEPGSVPRSGVNATTEYCPNPNPIKPLDELGVIKFTGLKPDWFSLAIAISTKLTLLSLLKSK